MMLAERLAGMASAPVVGVAAALLAFLLTGVVRRVLVARAVLDVPNERSLHSSPTPRGGGLAVALVILTGIGWLGIRAMLSGPVVLGLAGGAMLIALVGWVDDVRTLPNRVRAGVQVVAAVWFLYWIGGVNSLRLGETLVPLGFAGNILALLGIAWSINLYNFMDGIDGVAGGQAVVAGGVGAALLTGVGGLSAASALVAGASLGFLYWNWAPARIFMGDVGSGLLGFLFAALALLSDRSGGPGVMVWLMLGGVFIVDATLTLLRRMLAGERWYAAHRSHAYQRAVQAGWSHAAVTCGALGLTCVGAGLAWIAVSRPGWTWVALVTQLLLLVGAYRLIERRNPMQTSGPASPT